eukprot:TRINITY_DN28271_c0_g1_i1.p1 TRINITY_DN28271_c0_g1~~TRINITY_DN28271_c0_g1_i1.p1  ORF type:complete len:218 (+),score=-16.84 TRINITY_DN28271_c0_g1_i1:113-766(+)
MSQTTTNPEYPAVNINQPNIHTHTIITYFNIILTSALKNTTTSINIILLILINAYYNNTYDYETQTHRQKNLTYPTRYFSLYHNHPNQQPKKQKKKGSNQKLFAISSIRYLIQQKTPKKQGTIAVQFQQCMVLIYLHQMNLRINIPVTKSICMHANAHNVCTHKYLFCRLHFYGKVITKIGNYLNQKLPNLVIPLTQKKNLEVSKCQYNKFIYFKKL